MYGDATGDWKCSDTPSLRQISAIDISCRQQRTVVERL
jgi:hypothetical protein